MTDEELNEAVDKARQLKLLSTLGLTVADIADLILHLLTFVSICFSVVNDTMMYEKLAGVTMGNSAPLTFG